MTVVHDGQNNFLGMNLRSWVEGMDGDIFNAKSKTEAIRVAKKLAGMQGRCIFVSTNYGFVDQTDFEISAQGNIVNEFQPNGQ